MSGSFFGLPFAIFKLATAAVLGVIGGLVTTWAGGAGADAGTPSVDGAGSEPHPKRTARDGVRHAFEVLRTIWRWLVFGVVVSAALTTILPPDALAGVGKLGTVGAAVAALVISMPLYVCATASVPIAAALVHAGMPAGAALVFLIAGPATNVATVGAVYRTLGARILGIYLATVAVGSTAAALLFESVLSRANHAMAHAHAHSAWWSAASAWLLVVLFLWFAAEDVRAWISSRRVKRAPVALRVGVEGMSCAKCVGRVTRELEGTDGVEAAAVDLASKSALVSGTADRDAVFEAIRRAGYTPHVVE
ncbi:MAG: permease [Myxococcales bacterium]|nr:permease [Myxococcales bacterium]